MSHRKVFSEGNVPFSWEEKPGVSKQELFTSPLYYLDNTNSNNNNNNSPYFSDDSRRIIPPPPPCPAVIQPSRRSFSNKVLLWRQDDPFLAAFKECTKTRTTLGDERKNLAAAAAAAAAENKKSGVVESSRKKAGRMSRFMIFSCKQSSSCDVEEDHNNLVKKKLSHFNPNLPRIPSLSRHRYRGPIKFMRD